MGRGRGVSIPISTLALLLLVLCKKASGPGSGQRARRDALWRPGWWPQPIFFSSSCLLQPVHLCRADHPASHTLPQEVSCTEKDVEDLAELGHGAFGCVRQMRHKQLGVTFAVKVCLRAAPAPLPGSPRRSSSAATLRASLPPPLLLQQIRDTIDPLARRQLLTDLEVIKRSSCPYIVRYFGFHVTEGDIWIFMEEMRYSLDKLIDRLRERELRFPEPALGKIVFSILSALDYLKSEHGVMHRGVLRASQLP